MKEFFEAIELEIIRFRNVDIITSSPKYEDDETEMIPA